MSPAVQVIVVVSAVLTALGIIGRVLLQPLFRGAKTVEGINRWFAEDPKTGRCRMDSVAAELFPNSGSSLRDSVNRIEDVVSTHVEAEERHREDVALRLDTIEFQIGQHINATVGRVRKRRQSEHPDGTT